MNIVMELREAPEEVLHLVAFPDSDGSAARGTYGSEISLWNGTPHSVSTMYRMRLLPLNSRYPVRDSELLKDFGRGLVHRQGLMASVAILLNGLAGSRYVGAVMTAEATGRLGVSEVVRIGAPRNREFRKH